MAIIYTNQSSAIRRLRRRKPTKAYLESSKKTCQVFKETWF